MIYQEDMNALLASANNHIRDLSGKLEQIEKWVEEMPDNFYVQTGPEWKQWVLHSPIDNKHTRKP